MGLYGLLYFWKRDRQAGHGLRPVLPAVRLQPVARARLHLGPAAQLLLAAGGDKAHSNLLALPLLYRNRPTRRARTTVSLLGYGHSGVGNSNGLDRSGCTGTAGGPTAAATTCCCRSSTAAGRATGGTLGSPLGYYSRDGENKRGAVAVAVLVRAQAGRRRSRKSYDVLFPLLWSFRSPQSNTTVVPPFLHLRRPSLQLHHGVPAVLGRAGPPTRVRLEAALPALLLAHRRGGRRPSPGSRPLGGYRRDDERDTHTRTLLLPLFFHRRDPQRELDVVPVRCYWRHRDPHDGATTTLLANFYRRSDPAGLDHHPVPAVLALPRRRHRRHRPHAASRSTSGAAPRRDADRGRRVPAVGLLPQLHRRRLVGAGLFPLAFFGCAAPTGATGCCSRCSGTSATGAAPPPWPSRSSSASPTAAAPRRPSRRCSTSTDGRARRPRRPLPRPVPAVLALLQRPDRHHHHGGPAALLAQRRSDGWSAGLFPLLFAGNWRDRGALRAVPAVLALPRRQGRPTTHRGAQLPAPPARRRDHRRPVPAAVLAARRPARAGSPRPASRCSRWSTTSAPPTSRVFVSPHRGRQPHARAQGGLHPALLLVPEPQRRGQRRAPAVLRHHPPGHRASARACYGPWVSVDAPKSQRRACCSRCSAATRDEKETRHLGLPDLLPPAHHTTATRSTPLLPLFWYSRSPGHSTTVVGPWYRRARPGELRHRPGPALRLRPQPATGASWLTPLFYDRRELQGRHRQAVRRAAVLPEHPARRAHHRGFPLYWARPHRAAQLHRAVPAGLALRDDRGEQHASTWSGPFYWSSTRAAASARAGSCRWPGTRATTRSARPRTPCCRCSTRNTAPASRPC